MMNFGRVLCRLGFHREGPLCFMRGATSVFLCARVGCMATLTPYYADD